MIIWIALGLGIAGVCVWLVVRAVLTSGITGGPDKLFGDQQLKTAVALIELHHVRFGRYPDRLRDLKFTGSWDQIAIQSVTYHPDADRTAYFLEVQRGWIGNPILEMPPEFWEGTGLRS